MIRHLLKLVWKRKRANALLIVEILASFIVVFAVVTLAASMLMRWRKPLGFDYHDVWRARIDFGSPAEMSRDTNHKAQRLALVTMVREARTMPQVEAVAVADTPPYGTGTWISTVAAGGKRVQVFRDSASDDYATVLRMPLIAGRWFNAEDESASVEPVVLARDAAMALFGTVDCIGRTIDLGGGEPAQRAISGEGMGRVVGVLAAFRKNGELSDDQVRMVFTRTSLLGDDGKVSRCMLMRMRPGTPADYEETLLKRLHGVAPAFEVQIQHLEQSRELMNKLFVAPAVVGGIVAAFLITMVALGLSGVLWQTVTRRTREIGLRRALGATGNEVNRQILLEVALLATLALIIGVIVVAQLPLLGIFTLVSPASFSFGLIGALATIYGLTLLCGLYPSWLAGRVQPAQALHYE